MTKLTISKAASARSPGLIGLFQATRAEQLFVIHSFELTAGADPNLCQTDIGHFVCFAAFVLH